MKGIRVKKDEEGLFRLFHVGIELPGRYPSYWVAKEAFKLSDQTLLKLNENAWKKTGQHHGIVEYKDVALELAKERSPT